jgi:hypothetical protein
MPIKHYAYNTLGDGAFRRLSDQIADLARKNGPGGLTYSFRGAYDFG